MSKEWFLQVITNDISNKWFLQRVEIGFAINNGKDLLTLTDLFKPFN